MREIRRYLLCAVVLLALILCVPSATAAPNAEQIDATPTAGALELEQLGVSRVPVVGPAVLVTPLSRASSAEGIGRSMLPDRAAADVPAWLPTSETVGNHQPSVILAAVHSLDALQTAPARSSPPADDVGELVRKVLEALGVAGWFVAYFFGKKRGRG